MKVSEMPAGRELDALVAVRVMGWTLCNRVAMGWGDGPPVFATGEDPYDDTARPSRQDWRPSENITAAWEVVEKMAACHPSLHRYVLPDLWRCVMNVNRHAVSAMALTGQLAICRAALLAVGITDV
jgi:hypothetical protein